MEKRNKLWRRRQLWRVFKGRMILYAGYGRLITNANGHIITHAHWFELARHKSCFVYKSTGTPCSCHLCRGIRYNRGKFKKETQRIIEETYE